MPVYNAEPYLDETIRSILAQTYKDFELLIIDDGSTDKSAEIIQSYSDKRIVFISRANKGQTATLNEALKLAKGEYIARHDADDTSMPDRFQQQIEFMQDHPDVDLLGTNYEVVHEDGAPWFTTNLFTEPDDIKLAILFTNQFGHGTIMARAHIFKDFSYDESFKITQDYDLWSRIARSRQTANLRQPLYKWRYYAQSLSTGNAKLTEEEAGKVREREADYFISHRSRYRVFAFRPFSTRQGARTYCVHKSRLLRDVALLYNRRGFRLRALGVLAVAWLCDPLAAGNYGRLLQVLFHNKHESDGLSYETK